MLGGIMGIWRCPNHDEIDACSAWHLKKHLMGLVKFGGDEMSEEEADEIIEEIKQAESD